jgi:hypothetical protein
VADPALDTATQRLATGLDQGARGLVLRVLDDVAGLDAIDVVDLFFRDRFGSWKDYFSAVRDVWGAAKELVLRSSVSDAEKNAKSLGVFADRDGRRLAGAYALLVTAPEPDFRTATTEALRTAGGMESAADRISQICQKRGAPWIFSPPGGFEYVGDEEVERELVRPALAAINRPEFAGGVRAEFEAARAELAKGTPDALKQAIHEAGCAVESAMKVVLGRHNATYSEGDTASPLFEHLEQARIVPRYMQNLVLVAMSPRNKLGGHGAGDAPHDVDPSVAASVVAGAAGAIAYLATCLP